MLGTSDYRNAFVKLAESQGYSHTSSAMKDPRNPKDEVHVVEVKRAGSEFSVSVAFFAASAALVVADGLGYVAESGRDKAKIVLEALNAKSPGVEFCMDRGRISARAWTQVKADRREDKRSEMARDALKTANRVIAVLTRAYDPLSRALERCV